MYNGNRLTFNQSWSTDSDECFPFLDYVLAASKWYGFHVRFALPTTLWLFRCEVVVSLICCCFCFVLFPFNTFGLCACIGTDVFAHTPAFVQLDEINHPIRGVYSFFSRVQSSNTQHKRSNWFLFSFTYTYSHIYLTYAFAKQKIQPACTVQRAEIFVAISGCVWETEWVILKRGNTAYTFARVQVCWCVELLERFAYDVCVPSNKQSVKQSRTKSCSHLKCTIAWSGAEHCVRCTS